MTGVNPGLCYLIYIYINIHIRYAFIYIYIERNVCEHMHMPVYTILHMLGVHESRQV